MDIKDIRRQNLLTLIKQAGSRKKLCELSKISYNSLTQVLSRQKLPSGRSREIGDEIARKVETGMNKPPGWLDQQHDNGLETVYYTQLDTATLKLVLDIIDDYLIANYDIQDNVIKAHLIALAYKLLNQDDENKPTPKMLGEILRSVYIQLANKL